MDVVARSDRVRRLLLVAVGLWLVLTVVELTTNSVWAGVGADAVVSVTLLAVGSLLLASRSTPPVRRLAAGLLVVGAVAELYDVGSQAGALPSRPAVTAAGFVAVLAAIVVFVLDLARQ